MHHRDDLLQGILIFLQEVGDYDSDTSAYARHAVNQDVGLFSGFFYEGEGLVEKEIEGIILMIFGRNVQVVGDSISGVLDKSRTSDWQDSPDALACMKGKLLWRRAMFWAAGKLEMKMEPRPVMLSNTHSISYILNINIKVYCLKFIVCQQFNRFSKYLQVDPNSAHRALTLA